MSQVSQSFRAGFTLIGWLAVLGILVTVLIPIAIPVLLNLMDRPRFSADTDCQGRARAIATAVLAYAHLYDGWTHPDPDYYVKLFGHRLSSEPGYYGENAPWYDAGAANPGPSQRYAAGIGDFCCPLDKIPGPNKHGICSSYQLAPGMAGVNLNSIPGDPMSILVVTEVGERHPKKGKKAKQKGYCVYADLHVTLGPETADEKE